MNANCIIVAGKKRQEISLEEDLYFDATEAEEIFHELHHILKPHLMQTKNNFAYIIVLKKGILFEKSQEVMLATGLTKNIENFENFIFQKGPFQEGPYVSPIHVIKIELRNEQLFTTPIYTKNVEDIKAKWDVKGITALDP